VIYKPLIALHQQNLHAKSAQQTKKAQLKKLVTLILGMKVLAIAARIPATIVVTVMTATIVVIAMTVVTATTATIVVIAMTVVIVVATVIVIVIATVIATALHAKSVNQLFPKMTF
jgi:hypothetical protein